MDAPTGPWYVEVELDADQEPAYSGATSHEEAEQWRAKDELVEKPKREYEHDGQARCLRQNTVCAFCCAAIGVSGQMGNV